MSEVRVILVGLGARSRIWREVIDADPRARIVGLVDTDPTRLAEAAADRPGVATGPDLAGVAVRVDADAALLVTPPSGRHAQIWAAAEAGLAILAEKPLADSLADAEAHVATARAAGVPLMVGLNFRYLAVTRALKALFAPDRLGPPAFGRFLYERWRDGRQAHLNRYPLTMDQPMLWEQSIHHFDLMRHVYGAECTGVAARTWNPPWSMYRGDANVAALLTFEGGLEVTYQGTWAANRNNLEFDWRTDCARGIAVQADMVGDLSWALRDDPAPTPVDLPPTTIWRDDAAGLLADVLAHLLDGAPIPCPGDDHLNSLRIVEAVLRSAATGTTINPARMTSRAEPAGRTPPSSTEREGRANV